MDNLNGTKRSQTHSMSGNKYLTGEESILYLNLETRIFPNLLQGSKFQSVDVNKELDGI